MIYSFGLHLQHLLFDLLYVQQFAVCYVLAAVMSRNQETCSHNSPMLPCWLVSSLLWCSLPMAPSQGTNLTNCSAQVHIAIEIALGGLWWHTSCSRNCLELYLWRWVIGAASGRSCELEITVGRSVFNSTGTRFGQGRFAGSFRNRMSWEACTVTGWSSRVHQCSGTIEVFLQELVICHQPAYP